MTTPRKSSPATTTAPSTNRQLNSAPVTTTVNGVTTTTYANGYSTKAVIPTTTTYANAYPPAPPGTHLVTSSNGYYSFVQDQPAAAASLSASLATTTPAYPPAPPGKHLVTSSNGYYSFVPDQPAAAANQADSSVKSGYAPPVSQYQPSWGWLLHWTCFGLARSERDHRNLNRKPSGRLKGPLLIVASAISPELDQRSVSGGRAGYVETAAGSMQTTMNVTITLNNNTTNSIRFNSTGGDLGNIDEITVP